MNAQKDIWGYGAIDADGEFYGPLEFFELEDVQEFLQQNNLQVHSDEADVGDEPIFELQDGERVDVECFTIMYKPMFAELGYDWDHADNR